MFLNFGYNFNKEPSTPKERIRIKIAAHKGSEIMWLGEHCINGAQTHQSSLLELTFSISKKHPIFGTYFRSQTCERPSESWTRTDNTPNLDPTLTSGSKTHTQITWWAYHSDNVVTYQSKTQMRIAGMIDTCKFCTLWWDANHLHWSSDLVLGFGIWVFGFSV